MDLQLSSGKGPMECELAVGKLLRSLKREFPSVEIISSVRGKKADCFQSVILRCNEDLSFLEGSIKWICQSPYRPNHKRKNWFVDISLLESREEQGFEDKLVKFETFYCGGKGGQRVNKVETGVRAIYIPTGMAVVSTEARSQHMNKRIALERLGNMITMQNNLDINDLKSLNRLEHLRLERGNAVRVYEGEGFVLVQNKQES